MAKDDEKDPYDGVGGAYVIDKKTGKRVQQQAPTGPAKANPEPLKQAGPANQE